MSGLLGWAALDQRQQVGPACICACRYHRQQDQGDMWLVMAADDQEPPWDAATTLRATHKHDTIFTW
jgi:hypothetical protein